MRRGAAGLAASLGLALLLFYAPAVGAKHSKPKPIHAQLPASMAGAVTITWHGDPARGCAAAGVCDVTGSLTYTPSNLDLEMTKVGTSRFFPGEITLDDFETSGVVRVRRDPPGGTPSACVDTVSAPFMLLDPTPLTGGRYRYEFSDDALAQSSLSAGRCTGPLVSDLRGQFPSGVLDMKALRRGPSLLNLSGRKPFTAGPFSGEMVSTLGIRIAALSHFGRPGDSGGVITETFSPVPSYGRRVRLLSLELGYKIARLSGTLTTAFSGTSSPLCDTLDSCGARGTISYATDTTHGDIFVFAERRLRQGEHATLRSALRDLRAGRLRIDGFADTPPDQLAHVSSTVTRPDDATCTGTATSSLPEIGLGARARGFQFVFGDLRHTDGPDPLRTRCAGPGWSDAVARLTGNVGRSRLGARRLTVALSRPGTFTSGAYSGTRSGALTLRLVRDHLKARVEYPRRG